MERARFTPGDIVIGKENNKAFKGIYQSFDGSSHSVKTIEGIIYVDVKEDEIQRDKQQTLLWIKKNI